MSSDTAKTNEKIVTSVSLLTPFYSIFCITKDNFIFPCSPP